MSAISSPDTTVQGRAIKIDRLAGYLHRAKEAHVIEKRGYVTQVIGLVIEWAGPMVAVGDVCQIEAADGERILSEVVGFRGECVLLMPLREVHGIQPGSPVVAM
jgi:flagellum-specific ATP synthase